MVFSSGSWRLRGYAVERLLGSGGAGQVWRGRALPSGDPVALKRLPIDDPEQLRRAETEAALLAALDHPHLIRLHAFVAEDAHGVLVLDLAEAGSLAGLLAARGRLTPGEVITALAPIGAALAYLHDEGVVHGDVSAGNILFDAAGRSMLSDVGTARLTGDSSDAMSTPAYVDPAVAAGCVPGPASDVFMLGAVALHALTGSPPWLGKPGEDGDHLLADAAAGRLPDVEGLLMSAGVADTMSAVVVRALNVDPHRRGTAADLALDLRYSGDPVAVELDAGRVGSEPTGGGGHRLLASGDPDPGGSQVDRTWAEPAADDLEGARGPAHPGPTGPRHALHAPPGRSAARRPAAEARAAAAGRRRPSNGSWRSGRSQPVEPAVGRRGTVFERPEFSRPVGHGGPGGVRGSNTAGGQAGSAPPTRLVGVRPKPVLPSSTRRRPRDWFRRAAVPVPAVDAPAGDDSFVDHSGDWSGEAVGADPRDRFSTRTAGSGRRRAATRNVVPLLALVVLIAVGCGMAWWFVRTPSASAGAVGSAARQGSVQATSESPVGDLTPTQPLATSPALTDAQWTAALTTLDGAREQAYDQRRPDLLTHVYVAGNLLSTDVAQLRRIVPAGCGLAGARTSFTVEQISRRAGSAELVVSATLARSTLRCHGRTSGSAPGTAATRLRIDLVETADGPRIRGEARMT